MSSSTKKPLGKILLEQKVISKPNLDDFLEKQKQSGERLGSIVDKAFPEKHSSILKALSIQHGVPAINLEELVIGLDILRLVPRDVAVKNTILPVLEKDEHLFLVMADPQNHHVVDEIEFVTGKKVFRYVSLERNIKNAIDECYRLQESGEAFYRGSAVSSDKFEKLVAMKGRREARPAPAGPPPEPAAPPAAPTPAAARRPEALPMAEDLFGSAGSDDFSSETDELQPEAIERSIPSAPRQELRKVQEEEMAEGDDIPIDVESEKQETNILVVDDEEDILNLISKVLTENRYSVMTASTGREALAIVKKEPIDLIILDAMLPEIHGFDICKRIKGSAKYGHIPVIMISAIYRGWRFARDLKESYGVDEFVEKPFKIQQLLKIVETMLRSKTSAPRESKEEMSREAQKHMEVSAKAYRDGDLDTAIEHLKAAIRIDPLSQKLHYNLALVYGRAGLVYYAISELETVLELEPTMFQAMKNLAILYQEAGFKNKAIEMWERALSTCEDEESKQKIREHLVGLL